MSIQDRQWSQLVRIHQGIESGQLRHGEVAALRSGQQQTRDVVEAARADGTVDGAERSLIGQLQNLTSADIFEAKHNGAVQPGLKHGAHRVEAREYHQAQRIARGLDKGELSQHEARMLMAQQRDIFRAEAMARADGVVSPAERARLEQLQDNASLSIRWARHNGAPTPHPTPHPAPQYVPWVAGGRVADE